MNRFYKIILIAALFMAFAGTAHTGLAAGSTTDPSIKALNKLIAGDSSNYDLYNRRAQRYDAMDEYAAAAQDLKTSCDLMPDPNVKEPCYGEVKEYKALHRVP